MASIATVFGGSGFVGRYVVQRLAKAGWRVRVAVRRPNEAIFVRPYGVPGQVEPVLANIRDEQSVAESVRGAEAVINCVGILLETRQQKFKAVHSEAAGRIARLASEAGAQRLIHISAIGADTGSESRYAQSKGEGEQAVADGFDGAVMLRPSIVFGTEDRFFNKFAAMARASPVVPVISGNTRFQPVYVGDVAAAVVQAVENPDLTGVFELGGPEIATFRELMERMLLVVRRRRLVTDIPVPIGRLKAGFFDFVQIASGGLIENNLVTLDQIRQLGRDNVAGRNARTLEDFRITPTAMDAVLESYLYRFRPAGQYTAIHESAGALRNDAEQR